MGLAMQGTTGRFVCQHESVDACFYNAALSGERWTYLIRPPQYRLRLHSHEGNIGRRGHGRAEEKPPCVRGSASNRAPGRPAKVEPVKGGRLLTRPKRTWRCRRVPGNGELGCASTWASLKAQAEKASLEDASCVQMPVAPPRGARLSVMRIAFVEGCRSGILDPQKRTACGRKA
jgi:hypothetical protein